jgi:hypothetical protein
MGKQTLAAFPLACALIAIMFVALAGARSSVAQSESQITLSYTVIGGGPYEAPTAWYYLNGHNVSARLSTTPTTFIADVGSPWGVSKSLPGSNSTSLRWENGGTYVYGTTYGFVYGQSMVIDYYRQYYATFGLPGHVAETALYLPKVNYTSLGVEGSLTAGGSAWADYLTPYNYSSVPTVLPGSRWYAPNPAGVITGAFAINPRYLEQYQLNFSLSSSGTVQIRSTTFAGTFGGSPINETITAPGGSFWLDVNSSVSFQPVVHPESGDYRWVVHTAESLTALRPADVSLVYYEQYPMSVSFTVSGGASPSGPVINGTSNGQVVATQLYPGAPTTWLDTGSSYSVSPLLLGSTSVERWSTASNTTGVANGPTNINLTYYHQVLVEFSYSVAGGGSIPSPNATLFSFGKQSLIPLGPAQRSIWADFGTVLALPGSFPGSSPSERWELGSASSMVLTSPETLSLVYYHQFLVPTAYSVSGGGTPTLPMLSGFELGASFNSSVTTGNSVWLDAGSAWEASAVVQGGVGERWAAVGSTNGFVGGSTAISISYEHEFYVTIAASPRGSGTLTQGSWVGAGESATISESPEEGWAFAGWRGMGQGSYSGSDQTFSVTVSNPIQETASFDVGFAVQVMGAGSVQVSFYGSSYTVTGELTFYVPPGTNVTLAAKPGLLQSFEGWQGIPGGGASSVLIPAVAPVSLTANFTINQVEALGIVVLVCGIVVYLIAYLAWNRRASPRRIWNTLNRRGTSFGQ